MLLIILKLSGYREKEELNSEAAEKVEEVIAELQKHHDPAVQKIILGFTHFKITNFE